MLFVNYEKNQLRSTHFKIKYSLPTLIILVFFYPVCKDAVVLLVLVKLLGKVARRLQIVPIFNKKSNLLNNCNCPICCVSIKLV